MDEVFCVILIILEELSVIRLLLPTESNCEDFIKPYAENRSFGFLTSQVLKLLEKKFVQVGRILGCGDRAILTSSLEFPVFHEAFKFVEEDWLDIWYSAKITLLFLTYGHYCVHQN